MVQKAIILYTLLVQVTDSHKLSHNGFMVSTVNEGWLEKGLLGTVTVRDRTINHIIQAFAHKIQVLVFVGLLIVAYCDILGILNDYGAGEGLNLSNGEGITLGKPATALNNEGGCIR